MEELTWIDATDMAQLIAAGEISAAEAVDAAFDPHRIARARRAQ